MEQPVPDSALNVFRADLDRQMVALRILLSQFPPEEQEARLVDTLQSVERGAINLDGLWLAEQHDQPVGAALVMAQTDGVSLVWLPVATCQGDEAIIRPALMELICRELDGPHVKFGQVLLSGEESAGSAWLAEYGFEIASELFFLARSLEEPLPESRKSEVGSRKSEVRSQKSEVGRKKEDGTSDTLPSDFRLLTSDFETFDEPHNFDRFARLIEQSYLASLDCPRLNGQRTGVDAIAGHRLSGQFHPRGWRLYRQDDEDAAVLLLNEHPDQDAVELVYFGVAPEFRGQGWGRRMLTDAVLVSRSWNRAVIFLAVDAANTFANDLYAEFGFQEVARRVVWLRFPNTSARK